MSDVDLDDEICICGHRYDEHYPDVDGASACAFCDCDHFVPQEDE